MPTPGRGPGKESGVGGSCSLNFDSSMIGIRVSISDWSTGVVLCKGEKKKKKTMNTH